MKKNLTLLLLSFLLIASSYAQTTLVSQSFESATFPPTGWKLTNAGAGSNFIRNTTTALSLSGTSSLRCTRALNQPNNAWLFTPKVSLNTNPCNISFWVRVVTATDTGKLKFTVGTDTTLAAQTNVLMDSSNITGVTYVQWTTSYTPSTAGNYNFAFNCYSNARSAIGQGVLVDSIVITQLQNTCTGTPLAGTISSTSTLVCPANSITLSVSNANGGVLGLSYQWQSSIDSTNWVDILNDTALTSIKTGINTTTYYRRKTICVSSASFVTSAGIKIVANNLLNCICGPATGVNLHTGTSLTNFSIDTVKITGPGSNLNNMTSGISATGYILNSDSTTVPTAYVQQGITYGITVGLTVQTTPTVVNGISSVWIDWNHNGTFETSEYTRVITNAQKGTVNITVPANAILGATIMRVRSKTNTAGGLANTNACTSYTSGECEDYIVYVVPPAQCSGTPSGGAAFTTSTLVCSNVSYTVTVNGATSNIGGLKYQWQSSVDSLNWTDLTNDTAASITKNGLASSTFYRRKITCNASSLFAFSNGIKVTLNSYLNCYCGPNTGVNLNTGTTGASIDTVQIIGTNLDNQTAGIATGGYTLNDDSLSVPTAKLQQGLTYSLFVGLTTVTVPVAQNGIASAWFDWNHNGTFDSTEYVRVITNLKNGTISFTVPTNAQLGATMMRVRSKNNTGAGLLWNNPCTSYTNGETEDYVIYVIPTIICSGNPTGGITVSSAKPVCANTQFVLSVTGAASGVGGLSYQWQSSTDGTTWNDIMGETRVTDTIKLGITATTYYRRKITCNAGGFSYSSIDTIKINAPINCYCSPNTGVNLNTGGTGAAIDSVNIIGSTWVGNISSGLAPQYTLYNDSNVVAFPKLQQAGVYTLSVGLTNLVLPPTTGIASAWLDYDQNGKFDSSEYARIITNGQRGSVTFTVPANAPLGKTVLRIRSKNNAGAGLTALLACTSYTNGETEDYVVSIIAGNACTASINPGTAFSNTKAVCAGRIFNVLDTGSTNGVLGLMYQWQTSTDSLNWVNIVGATSGNLIGTSITTKTFFRRATSCGATTAFSNGVSIATYSINYCAYCSPLSGSNLYNVGGAPTVDSVILLNSLLVNNATGSNAVGYYLDTTKPVPSLYKTLNYNVRVKLSGNGLAGAWIDFDNSKTFDSTEFAPITITATAGVATFTVPTNAVLGKSLLRIRSRATGVGATLTKTDGCTTFPAGETEDYVVSIEAVPACLPPSNATSSNITATSAVVKWTAATTVPTNGYNIFINTTNNFATATLVATGVTIDSTIISGLSGTTTYYVWILANCGANVSPTIATTFTTACGVYINLPIVEGFENQPTIGIGIVPQCWSVTTQLGGTNFTTSQTALRNGFTSKSGARYIYTRRNNYNWLISPAIQLTAGTTYYFNYYYRPTDPNNGITLNTFVSSLKDTTNLKLGPIGTSVVNAIDSSKYTQNINSFTPTTTGAYYFAIQSINLATIAANNNLNIDDISITNTLVNNPPTITSFTPTRATAGSLLTIKGTNFSTATAVRLGVTNVVNFTKVNDSTITLTVGNGSTGFVKVSNTAGTDSLAGFVFCTVATTKNSNLNGCGSVTFNNKVYTTSISVRDTVRNITGCDSVYNVTNISVSATPTLTNVTSNSPIMVGDSIKLNADTTKATAMSWSGPNGFTSALKNPKIASATTAMSGWYFVTIINGACIKKDSVNVVVNSTTASSITGRLVTPNGKLVNNAVCNLTGSATHTTNSSLGNYGFTNLSSGAYSIKATKNNDVAKSNGVNSVDILLTQRHILNTNKLNSPYKIIAADVDGNKLINSTDILRMKRLILGTDTTFRNTVTNENRLWAFVDSSFVFPDTTNPFPFKDSITIDGLASNKPNQTFIGVHLGDVNYDWNAAVAKQSTVNSQQSTDVKIGIESVIENQIVHCKSYIVNPEKLTSIQTTIHFDNTKYEFISLSGLEYNATKANETGDIAILWVSTNGETKEFIAGENLFELVLRKKEFGIGYLELGISLNNKITNTQATDAQIKTRGIKLVNSQQSTVYSKMLTVYPNPAKDILNIVSQDEIKEVKIFNVLGKQVVTKVKSGNFVNINIASLSKGVYVVKTITINGNIVTEKLIVE